MISSRKLRERSSFLIASAIGCKVKEERGLCRHNSNTYLFISITRQNLDVRDVNPYFLSIRQTFLTSKIESLKGRKPIKARRFHICMARCQNSKNLNLFETNRRVIKARAELLCSYGR